MASVSLWRSGSNAVAGVVSASARTSMIRSPGVGRRERKRRARSRKPRSIRVRTGARPLGDAVRARTSMPKRIEDQHMIARGRRRHTQPQLRNRQQQQRHAGKLQQQRERLLDAAAAGDHSGVLCRDPKAQRRNYAAGAASGPRADITPTSGPDTDPNSTNNLSECEIQKMHQREAQPLGHSARAHQRTE